MKRYLGLLSIFLIFTHCSFFQKDPIVLQINSKTWTAKEFSKLLAQKTLHFSIQDVQDQNTLDKVKDRLIGDLIVQEIIQNWANKNNIKVSKKEINQETQKIIQQYPTEDAFYSYLKTIKTEEKQWKSSIRNNLLSKKIVQHINKNSTEPNQKEIEEFYRKNPLLFKKPPGFLIRHFFHTKKEVAKRIKNLLNKKENFKTLVEQFSQTPQPNQLKWIKEGDFSVFDQAFELKKGEISSILPSLHGYHIIEIIEKRKAKNLSFEQVKEDIIKKLKIKKQKALFKDWLDKEGKKVHILKNIEILKQIKIKSL